jgi:mannose-6-phosphate isomerase-like protein (cupin superfamily)
MGLKFSTKYEGRGYNDLPMKLFRGSDLKQAGRAYVECVRTRDLSAGVYRLPAGGRDLQQPHTEDEVYYVVSGRARLVAGADEVPVRTGDVLFVPAGEPHRFEAIEEDLELIVFFGPAEGSRGAGA